MSKLQVDGAAESDQSNLHSVSANDEGGEFAWGLKGKSVDNCLISW